jgi:prepilin signal peptidase PulO-like enzyme (type II secretory pathway)
MEFLPTSFLFIFFFLFGLIIGSFLDVVVTRFNTGASLNGRSRCLSCGHQLSWYELVPLLSYLILLGRCHGCGSHIPLRLLFTECLTAVLFVWCVAVFGLSGVLVIVLPLIAVLVLVFLYDYNHMIIPHTFVYILLCLGAVYLLYIYFGTPLPRMLMAHLLTASVTASFFGALWFVSKGRWIGLGDAKLAFALSIFLSPMMAFSMVVFSFWIGAFVSVLLLCIQRISLSGKKHLRFLSLPLTMKSEIPFAPFLIVAFVMVFVGGITLGNLLEHIYGVTF